jgi:hypothetical protein
VPEDWAAVAKAINERAKETVAVSGEMLLSRLDAVERRLNHMTRILNDMKTDVKTVLEHVRPRR